MFRVQAVFVFLLFLAFSGNDVAALDKEGKDGNKMAAYKKATFAGGCFWCMEPPFEKLDGVSEVISGYSGGEEASPTYKRVSSGKTGHYEVVQVVYDERKVKYKELLDVFWRQIDPTDSGGSFVDRGPQYRSAIFVHDEEQRVSAIKSKDELQKSGIFTKPVATEIIDFEAFYPAEDYHQDYYKRNPLRYKFYRTASGRDKFIEKNWKKNPSNDMGFVLPADEELRKSLSPLQYEVTRENGTEPPFKNEFWDNKKAGIYVDIISGEPLFSSLDKYDSGTGWPSFTKPLASENIVEKEDNLLFYKRTEVRSRNADSHLGHVFNDGPGPTGLRYCINSAALRFVPLEEMQREGYAEFVPFFSE